MTRSLVIMMLAGTMWAQMPATPKAPAKSPANPAVQASAKPSAAMKPVAVKPAASAVKPVGVTSAKPATHAVAEKPKAAETKVAIKTVSKPGDNKLPAKPVQAIAKSQVPAKKEAAKPVTAASAENAHAKSPFAAKKAPKPHPKIVEKASAKEAETATRVTSVANMPGKRDPFVSPIVRATRGGIGASCETGKRCLMVDQIQLMGIVKSPSGFIAVVENAAKRSYFLRENDPIFNGSVAKITGDSVVFREQTVDKLGKQSVREVVKKVNAPVV